MNKPDSDKLSRGARLMEIDRQIIRDHLKLLILHGSIKKGRKLSRSEALTFFMNELFKDDNKMLEKIAKAEKRREIKRD